MTAVPGHINDVTGHFCNREGLETPDGRCPDGCNHADHYSNDGHPECEDTSFLRQIGGKMRPNNYQRAVLERLAGSRYPVREPSIRMALGTTSVVDTLPELEQAGMVEKVLSEGGVTHWQITAAGRDSLADQPR